MKDKKTLIAVDEPSFSEVIVKTAVNFLNNNLHEITLLNVLETTSAEDELFLRHPEIFLDFESSKNNFEQLKEYIINNGFEFNEILTKEGIAAKHIKKIAKEDNYDLTVIGSSNKNVFEKILLGSTSYKVIRECPSSILIVKPSEETNLKDEINVLVATDGSSCSDYMTANLINYLDKDKAKLSIINIQPPIESVIPHDVYSYIDIPLIKKEANTLSETILNKAESDLKGCGFTIQTKKYIEGYIAPTIIEEAENQQIDLIVLGKHCNKDTKGFFPGSVGLKVYESSSKPVLIIK